MSEAALRRGTHVEAAGSGALAGAWLLPTIGGLWVRLSVCLFVLFFTVPVAVLLWRAAAGGSLLSGIRQPLVIHALLLTLITTSISVLIAIVFGTPLAFALARRKFRGRQTLEVLLTLPLVLPPLVAGVALLVAFGRRGLLGEPLDRAGISLPFTTVAVVMAQLFVAAPFFVRAARIGFTAVSREMEEAAAMSGADPWHTFQRVILPLALPGVVSGVVLCAARAFSEFGATLMFAGNIEGRTQTMALAIETAIQTDLNSALALSLVLVVIAALALTIPLLLLHGTETF
ncbi:MAG TPA: ABC transporter permease [Chloroflexota bacterium]|nr:ABC transporter permease [Chloroflexota bacterium]